MKKNKGFTLVELLAVIIVLAIIMVIAIPTVTTVMNNARKNALYEYALKVNTKALETYLAENTELAGSDISSCAFYTLPNLMNNETSNYDGFVRVNRVSNSLNPTYDVYISIRDTNFAVENIHINSSDMNQGKFLKEVDRHSGTTISLNDCSGNENKLSGSQSNPKPTTKPNPETSTKNTTQPITTSSLLSKLEVVNYPINFNKNTLTYAIQVDNKDTSVQINATAEYPSDVSIEIKGNSSLKVGRNTVTITVTNNKNQSKSTYTIIVTRVNENEIPTTNETTVSTSNKPDETTSESTTMNTPDPTTQSTTINSTEPTKETTTKNTTNETTTSDGNRTTKSSGGNSGWTGTRRTTVPTTAWDPNSGNPSPYDSESDTTLMSLNVLGYNIGFKVNKYEYDIATNGEDKLEAINYRPNNPNAKVEVSGNENLSKGGIVIIKVTSENNYYSSEYVIYVTPIKKKSFLQKILPYVVIILGATMIILGIKVSSQMKASKERQRKRETEEEVGKMQMKTQMESVNQQIKDSQVQSQSKDNTNQL